MSVKVSISNLACAVLLLGCVGALLTIGICDVSMNALNWVIFYVLIIISALLSIFTWMTTDSKKNGQNIELLAEQVRANTSLKMAKETFYKAKAEYYDELSRQKRRN